MQNGKCLSGNVCAQVALLVPWRRYSDFIVNEISQGGQVVHLTRLQAGGDPATPSDFARAAPTAEGAQPAAAPAQPAAAAAAGPRPAGGKESGAAEPPAASAAQPSLSCAATAGVDAPTAAAPAGEERSAEADLAEFAELAGAENADVLRQLLADIPASRGQSRHAHGRPKGQQAELDVTSFDKLQACSAAYHTVSVHLPPCQCAEVLRLLLKRARSQTRTVVIHNCAHQAVPSTYA